MPPPGPPPRIPVTVLTGFLGAGKTTLLNRLLTEPAFRDTAVIVNEFGAIGVDADLIEQVDARAFAMTTGCLCCTVAGDVRLTLLRLAEAAARGTGPAFRRLVIETTGLADPAPVLHALMTQDLILERYALNGVVTVVDAATGAATLDRFGEARRQAAVADLILLSKTDLTEAPVAEALRSRLEALAPNARITRAAAIGAADVFGLAAFDPALKPPRVVDWLRFAVPAHGHGHAHDPGRHGSDVTAACFKGSDPLNAWDVQDAIEALQDALGPDLLRLKAIVQLDDDLERPVVLHAVQHILHPPGRLEAWPCPRGSRLIVISRGPRRAEVPEIVEHFLPSLKPAATPQGSIVRNGLSRPAFNRTAPYFYSNRPRKLVTRTAHYTLRILLLQCNINPKSTDDVRFRLIASG